MMDLGAWFRLCGVWLVLVGAACGGGSPTRLPDGGAADAAAPDAARAVTLARIEVTPVDQSLPSGTVQQLTATGVFSDSTTQDLTSRVTWTSDRVACATVSSAGSVTAVAPGTAVITAAMAGGSGSTTVTVTDAVLTGFTLTPVQPSVPAGHVQQFVVTGTFSDGTTLDLTGRSTWESDSDAIATMSNADGLRGLATGRAAGTTRITATFNGMRAETTLTVTDAVLVSVAVTPADPSVPLGRTLQLSAIGTFSDATTQDLTHQLTWASDAEATATVSNVLVSRGLATGRAPGSARITATLDGITGATVLTVTAAVLDALAVAPISPSLPAGRTQAFTVAGTFSDATVHDLTDEVTWASSDDTVAVISNAAGARGLVTGRRPGTVSITATLTGVTGTTDLTVTSAVLVSLAVTPADASVAAGRSTAFSATGTFSDATVRDLTTQVTWASSVPAVAVISNAADSRGLATGLVPGTTTITAVLPGVIGVTGATSLTVTDPVLTSIVVTPAPTSVAVGQTRAFTARGTFSDTSQRDLTDQVTWTSSLPAVAGISNTDGSRGVATGVAPGLTNITAALAGVTGTVSLTVTAAVVVAIAVAPSDPSVVVGRIQAFTATGTFSDTTVRDVTAQVAWASSVPAVATISNAAGSRGVASGRAAGTTSITAKLAGVTGATSLIVTDPAVVALAVAPLDPSVPLGRPQAFTATGTFDDASVRDVTAEVAWTSSLPAVATISNAAGWQGLATTRATGTTAITATLAGLTAATTLTVTDAVVASIAVTPARGAVARGQRQALTATGTFTDATVHDLTDQASWGSSLPGAVSVSNSDGSRGVASGLTVGTAGITASFAGVTGSTTLTVIDLGQIEFTFGHCLTLTLEEGFSIVGLVHSVDSARFLTANWPPFIRSTPVGGQGNFDLSCVPPRSFAMGDLLTLTLVSNGGTDTVTISFTAAWRAPDSLFALDRLGAQIVP